MKNVFLIFTFCLLGFSCKTVNSEDSVSPQDNSNLPEAGNYISFLLNSGPELDYRYNVNSNTWEWKYFSNYSFQPSPFGRLIFKEDGTYEFPDLKKTGTYKLDKNTKKVVFTGYLVGAEGYYKVEKGLCILHIVTLDANGKIKDTIRYEKRSTLPQPDIKNPNGDFRGTIVTSLSNNTTDFIDLSNAKTTNSYSSNAFPNTGLSAYSAYIYKEKPTDTNEVYPYLEVLDNNGKQAYKYKGVSKNGQKWSIGNYWYAVPSPDGTKIVLTGYKVSNLTNSLISIIDLKTGNELKVFENNSKYNWAASWTPKGELIMPKSEGGINLVSSDLGKTTTVYTKSVNDARVSINNTILVISEAKLYTMNIDGTNINPISEKQFKVTIEYVYDMTWGPDGKTFAILYKDPNKSEYNILLVKADGSSYSYLNDSKGDYLVLKSPFLNWK